MTKKLTLKPKPRPSEDDDAMRVAIHQGLTAEAEIELLHTAAGQLLQSLKNTHAWMTRNKLHMPPVSLTGMEVAIEKAEKAGISVPSEARKVPG
jgi:hypothetical protein